MLSIDRLRSFTHIASRPRTRRALRIAALAVPGAVLLLVAALFLFRDILLQGALDGRIQAFQDRHRGSVVSIDSARFDGLDRVAFDRIRLWSETGPLTVDARSCRVDISLWSLLAGRVRPTRVQVNDLAIDVRRDSLPDVESRRGPEMKPAREKEHAPRYSAQAAYLLNLFFTRTPDRLEVNRLTVRSSIDGIRQSFHVPRLAIDNPAFDTVVEVDEDGRTWGCRLAGTIDQRKRSLSFRVSPVGAGEEIFVPFVARQWGARVSFDSIMVQLKAGGVRRGVLHLDGILAIGGLTINHPRIAAEDVILRSARLEYALHVGRDYVELDRPTRAAFNRLSFGPYVRFDGAPTRRLTVAIDPTVFKADDFFASLPEGLFTRLAGIRTSGALAYRMRFFVDFAHPESVRLESSLEKRGFKIERFGWIDFRAINEPFVFTVYDRDRPVRSFEVGPGNPDFRTLAEISPYLRNAVLISEDGAFFEHRGFLLEHIERSIAADLRERRFVRGASTITMQLVKNLYLERRKTIARKLEEMIITWLIEENRLVPKERMLEIYLNVIEWGPGVRGAQEAARFYFRKDVEDLTLAEAIFMASVIPRPGRFMDSFDEYRLPRPWLKAYDADVSRKMLKRGMITQADLDELDPDIRLNGPARFLLKEGGAAPEDSVVAEDDPARAG